MPTHGKSPRNSLSDRLQRSRRHRSWLKNNAESSSIGGGASVASTGDVSTSSEPPHGGYNITATKSDDVPIKSTTSATSPEQKADSLHARRKRAMALGRRTRKSGGAASNAGAPSPKTSASIAPIPPKDVSIKQKKEAVQTNSPFESHQDQLDLGTQNSEDPVPMPVQPPPRPKHMTSPPPPPPPEQKQQPSHPMNMASPPPQQQPRQLQGQPNMGQQQRPPNMMSPPSQYQQRQQQGPPSMASPPPQYQQRQQQGPPSMASPPLQYQQRQQHGPPSMASPPLQYQQRQQQGPPSMASPPLQYQQRQQPVARSYQQGRQGQQPNVVSPAPSQAGPLSGKRYSTGTMPYQPRETPVSQPRTSNLPSVPQASEEMEEGSLADVNETNGGAVIEAPKVYSVSNLRASFHKAKEPSMPMNNPDPRHRHSLPVKSNDVRSSDERSDIADRPSWKNRAPSPTLPEPSNHHLPSGGSRPSWQNRGALHNPVSKGRESPTPPVPQTNNGRTSPVPRVSLPAPTQGSRPSWQNRSVQQAPPVPTPAQQPQQQASRHSWRQHAPGQQLPPTDSVQQPPPPKQLSQAAMARLALQNQLNQEAQPPSWQKNRPPPQAKSSWQPQPQTQEAPLAAPRASWQGRSQQQQQGQPARPQNRSSSSEEEPDEEDDEQQQPTQNQTRPSPVIAPPKNFAPNSQPRQQRDYKPGARPKRKKSLVTDSPLVPAILSEIKSTEEEMPLPPVVLPQKERPLPLVILPSKEAPKKELPPFILPSKEPPKKEPPPFILPSNEPPKKELAPVILSQKEFDTITNNSASNPGADSAETNGEDQLQLNYSESAESAGSWQDHSVSIGTSVSSPRRQTEKSPSNRPPLPSPQKQKSPWQKWADMQGHDDPEIVKEVQSPERDENVGSRTVGGIYVEEKKSSDDATAYVDDDELAGQEVESEDNHSTHLARLAADSTLIIDYEEAMKHASKAISDDEDDASYISGALLAQSSPLPQDVPLEFQEALAGSPRKSVESPGKAKPVEERPRTKPSLAEELMQKDSGDFQENDEEEAPVLEREIETYAAKEHLREDSGDFLENDEKEALVLEREIETYAAKEHEPERGAFDDSEHETQMKTPPHEPKMEALVTPGQYPVDPLEEIEEDDEEEEPSPTPTLPSTPKSGKRYPKLSPSARDNDMYPDVYRSIYFAEDMTPTSRGSERTRSSPRKGSSPALSQLSPEVENARTHLEHMELAERAAPVPYQGSYDSVELYVDDKNPMQQVPQLSPRKEVSPSTQAKYMGVGFLASSQSTEESSREHTSNLQTSYPEELIFSLRSRSRSNDQHESTYYPDPEFSDVKSEVESDAVFGDPQTYGAAGGEEQETISPSIKQRGHAIEEWQASLSPTKPVGQSPARPYEQPRVSTSPDKKKIASAAQIASFWANGSASREEEEEAEQFAETEEWKDRDPDFFPEVEDDDDDVYGATYMSEPRVKVAAAPHELEEWLQGSSQAAARGVSHLEAPVDPTSPSYRAWLTNSSFVSASGSQDQNDWLTPKKSKQKKKKQEVFDPFGDEEELKISNSGNLFSPHTDPFGMTEESFSPPSWDPSPRGRMSLGSRATEFTSDQSDDWQVEESVEI